MGEYKVHFDKLIRRNTREKRKQEHPEIQKKKNIETEKKRDKKINEKEKEEVLRINQSNISTKNK